MRSSPAAARCSASSSVSRAVSASPPSSSPLVGLLLELPTTSAVVRAPTSAMISASSRRSQVSSSSVLEQRRLDLGGERLRASCDMFSRRRRKNPRRRSGSASSAAAARRRAAVDDEEVGPVAGHGDGCGRLADTRDRLGTALRRCDVTARRRAPPAAATCSTPMIAELAPLYGRDRRAAGAERGARGLRPAGRRVPRRARGRRAGLRRRRQAAARRRVRDQAHVRRPATPAAAGVARALLAALEDAARELGYACAARHRARSSRTPSACTRAPATPRSPTSTRTRSLATGARSGSDRRGEDRAVAAAALGLVERAVGAADEVRRGLAAVPQRDARARRSRRASRRGRARSARSAAAASPASGSTTTNSSPP